MGSIFLGGLIFFLAAVIIFDELITFHLSLGNSAWHFFFLGGGLLKSEYPPGNVLWFSEYDEALRNSMKYILSKK